MNEERLQEIRRDAVECIQASALKQIETLDAMLKEHGPSLLRYDEATSGPMVMPKNIVTALMLREAWQWSPTGCRVQISTSHSAPPSTKKGRSVIDIIRSWL